MEKRLKDYKDFWLNKKIEYIIYILLGIATATLFWLFFSACLILESSPTILKDTLGSVITVLTAMVSVYFIIKQMKQTEKFQKETNTVQLIDNTLYNHFKKIDSQIENIQSNALSEYQNIEKEIPSDTQHDNIGTEDVEPNDNYFDAEDKKHQISKETSKKLEQALDNFFQFIYDIEIKIEHGIIDEKLIRIYFKEKIEEIFIEKIKTKLYSENDIYSIVLVKDSKREKIVNLSQRWYGKNYIEIKEFLKDKKETS